MPYPWNAGDTLNAADLNDYAGLVFIKSQTVTAGVASVTVTNAFSSQFDNYRVTLTGGAASSDGNVHMALGSTTTGYYAKLAYLPWGSTTWAFVTDSNAAKWTAVGVSRTTGLQAAINLYQPFNVARTVYESRYVGPKTNSVFGTSGGFVDNGTSYTSFTLSLSLGTFSYTPTIRVYGFNNG